MHLLVGQSETRGEHCRSVGRDQRETDEGGLGGASEDDGEEAVDASPANGLLFCRRQGCS